MLLSSWTPRAFTSKFLNKVPRIIKQEGAVDPTLIQWQAPRDVVSEFQIRWVLWI